MGLHPVQSTSELFRSFAEFCFIVKDIFFLLAGLLNRPFSETSLQGAVVLARRENLYFLFDLPHDSPHQEGQNTNTKLPSTDGSDKPSHCLNEIFINGFTGLDCISSRIS